MRTEPTGPSGGFCAVILSLQKLQSAGPLRYTGARVLSDHHVKDCLVVGGKEGPSEPPRTRLPTCAPRHDYLCTQGLHTRSGSFGLIIRRFARPSRRQNRCGMVETRIDTNGSRRWQGVASRRLVASRVVAEGFLEPPVVPYLEENSRCATNMVSST
jgi:hypothetical protein